MKILLWGRGGGRGCGSLWARRGWSLDARPTDRARGNRCQPPLPPPSRSPNVPGAPSMAQLVHHASSARSRRPAGQPRKQKFGFHLRFQFQGSPKAIVGLTNLVAKTKSQMSIVCPKTQTIAHPEMEPQGRDVHVINSVCMSISWFMHACKSM